MNPIQGKMENNFQTLLRERKLRGEPKKMGGGEKDTEWKNADKQLEEK